MCSGGHKTGRVCVWVGVRVCLCLRSVTPMASIKTKTERSSNCLLSSPWSRSHARVRAAGAWRPPSLGRALRVRTHSHSQTRTHHSTQALTHLLACWPPRASLAARGYHRPLCRRTDRHTHTHTHSRALTHPPPGPARPARAPRGAARWPPRWRGRRPLRDCCCCCPASSSSLAPPPRLSRLSPVWLCVCARACARECVCVCDDGMMGERARETKGVDAPRLRCLKPFPPASQSWADATTGRRHGLAGYTQSNPL